MAGSFVLDIILTVALVFTGVTVADNAQRIDHVQQVATDEALCPLYDVFLDAAAAPLARTPGEGDAAYQKRIEAREAAVQIIRHGHDALECKTR